MNPFTQKAVLLKNLKYKAIGIVSTGFPGYEKNVACDINNFQLYTDVAHYYYWIMSVVYDTYWRWIHYYPLDSWKLIKTQDVKHIFKIKINFHYIIQYFALFYYQEIYKIIYASSINDTKE